MKFLEKFFWILCATTILFVGQKFLINEYIEWEENSNPNYIPRVETVKSKSNKLEAKLEAKFKTKDYEFDNFINHNVTPYIKKQNVTQQSWVCEKKGSWGSFWWKVDRTQYKDGKGLYWYYVYMYSNSYLNTDYNNDGNYDRAISYISPLNVTMYEYNASGQLYNKYNVPFEYMLVDWEQYQVAYFYSMSPYTKIGVSYGMVSSYDNSRK